MSELHEGLLELCKGKRGRERDEYSGIVEHTRLRTSTLLQYTGSKSYEGLHLPLQGLYTQPYKPRVNTRFLFQSLGFQVETVLEGNKNLGKRKYNSLISQGGHCNFLVQGLRATFIALRSGAHNQWILLQRIAINSGQEKKKKKTCITVFEY